MTIHLDDIQYTKVWIAYTVNGVKNNSRYSNMSIPEALNNFYVCKHLLGQAQPTELHIYYNEPL